MTTENQKERLNPVGTLIMLRGIPGSGKTTLGNELMHALGTKAVGFNPDDFRYKDGKYDGSPASGDQIFALLDQMAISSLNCGKIVVWQRVWTTIKSYGDLQDQVKNKLHPERLLLIEIDIQKTSAWERIAKREMSGGKQRISLEEFDYYVNRYVSLKGKIPDNEFLSLKGEDDVRNNSQLIIKWLKKAMII